MPSYTLAYAASVVVAILSFAATLILGTYASGHGADLGLSPQVAAWLSVGAGVLGFISSTFLPAATRKPSVREDHYLAAMAGILPPDLQKKHGTPEVLAPPAPAEPPSRILPPP